MAIHYDSFRVHVLAALDVFFDDLAVLAMVARAHRRHRVTGQFKRISLQNVSNRKLSSTF